MEIKNPGWLVFNKTMEEPKPIKVAKSSQRAQQHIHGKQNLGDLYSIKQRGSQNQSWWPKAATEHNSTYMEIEKNLVVDLYPIKQMRSQNQSWWPKATTEHRNTYIEMKNLGGAYSIKQGRSQKQSWWPDAATEHNNTYLKATKTWVTCIHKKKEEPKPTMVAKSNHRALNEFMSRDWAICRLQIEIAM